MSLVQTMAQDDPTTHCFTFVAQASTSDRCKADLARLKEDLASMMKTELVVDMGSSRLCQNHIPLNFLWFLLLLVGVFLIL